MNVYEMEGFLRGKCIPRDILVNESVAAYLVRKLNSAATMKAERDALADRVNALAVENACLVRAINDHKNSTHFCERCGEDDPCATDDVCSVLRGIPDTDSAIATFEAQGVEKFADELHKTAMAICSVKPDNTTPGAYAGLARTFAKKLREAK